MLNFTGFVYVKSLFETNNLLKGTGVFKIEEVGYDEIIFKKFCGGGGGGDNNQEQKFRVIDRYHTGRWAFRPGG